ncbi:deoxyribonuclease V [Olivibacter domesticus]|uniref:Endonuclease V n=1 Tax=Olivibacter domesticus TaxID=407022 RepID=A0A1H7M6Q7_OLID1|nr:deoxyribonuclease V [Olivibacter domesticus]SEL06779.1 Endonuclease V [Olivibacter domesticus]
MQISPSFYDSLSIVEATSIQKRLRENLNISSLKKEIHIIGGADISLNRFSEVIYAGIVLLDYQTLTPIAYSLIKSKTTFPYVPGYLAFREIPALMMALDQLELKPDIIMVDGHGIAHPRRMGIAAHFGTLVSIPTMGCAKKKLYGKYEEPPLLKGAYATLRAKDELLGFVLRTKDKVSPVFVSPGNNMDFDECLQIAKHCMGKYRLLEPTRRAHEHVNLFRTGQLKEGFHYINQQTLF